MKEFMRFFALLRMTSICHPAVPLRSSIERRVERRATEICHPERNVIVELRDPSPDTCIYYFWILNSTNTKSDPSTRINLVGMT